MTTDPKMISRLLREKRDEFTKSASDSGETATKTKPGSVKKDPEVSAAKADQPEDAPRKEKDVVPVLDKDLKPGSKYADKKNPALSKAADVAARLAQLSQQVKSATQGTTQAQAPVQEKSATETYNLSQEALAKLASVILSTEEGAAVANELLEKSAGEDAARAMINEARQAAYEQAMIAEELNKQASYMEKSAAEEVEMLKQAAVNEVATDAAQLGQVFDESGLTEEDADEIFKMAAAHQEYIDATPELQHPLLKQAYAQGMDDAAAMQDAAAAGDEPELPMGGEDITLEKVQAVLQELIASGQIDEEDAMAILQDLAGGGEEAAPAQ